MSASNSRILCDIDKSVLVVTDIQPRLTAAMPAKVLARLQRHTSLLLKAANTLDIPVFATEQYPKGLGGLENEIVKLLPPGTKKFEKTSFSCAGAENFINELKQTDRDQIVMTGMETHVCILQSVIDLLTLGFNVVIPSDSVCSRQRENYETALYRMRQAGAVITNSESVIFEWIRDARHEKFKAIQPLLK